MFNLIKGQRTENNLPIVFLKSQDFLNPFVMNGIAHHYHFGESTFIFKSIRCDFKILFNFSMKFSKQIE